MMRNTDPARRQQRLERLQAAAREAGVKLTHQRLEIFRALVGAEEHPDAEAVFRAARRRVPTVSLDTVYRTLWRLHDLGLITTLGPRRDGIRFDANLDRHHHFACVRCGQVRDFESAALDALRVPAAVARLGRVLAARVEVRGLCARCGASRTPAASPRPRGRPARPAHRPQPGARHE